MLSIILHSGFDSMAGPSFDLLPKNWPFAVIFLAAGGHASGNTGLGKGTDDPPTSWSGYCLVFLYVKLLI